MEIARLGSEAPESRRIGARVASTGNVNSHPWVLLIDSDAMSLVEMGWAIMKSRSRHASEAKERLNKGLLQ